MNDMRVWVLISIIAVSVFSCSDQPPGADIKSSSETAQLIENRETKPGTIAVRGDVVHSLNLNIDSLRIMEVQTIENYKIVNHSGEVKRTIPTCKGILLRDILEKAHINQKDSKDRNFYITVKAGDGYMATFSWAELFNHATGDSTYLIFEEDGKPIAERGPFVLIATGDKITGVRHVYLVNEIEVHRVNA